MALVVTGEIGTHVEEYLALEAQASQPYNEFVYRDAAHAGLVRRYLFDARATDFAPPHGYLLLEDDRVVGMLACMPARDLMKRRMQTVFALRKSSFFEEDPGLAKRLQLAAPAFIVPEKNDYYISRLTIVPDARGRGLASCLLDYGDPLAREAGCANMVLEVSSDNEIARAMWLRHGYREFDRKKVVDPQSGRSIEYIHMSKPAPP